MLRGRPASWRLTVKTTAGCAQLGCCLGLRACLLPSREPRGSLPRPLKAMGQAGTGRRATVRVPVTPTVTSKPRERQDSQQMKTMHVLFPCFFHSHPLQPPLLVLSSWFSRNTSLSTCRQRSYSIHFPCKGILRSILREKKTSNYDRVRLRNIFKSDLSELDLHINLHFPCLQPVQPGWWQTRLRVQGGLHSPC